jgi:carotenoid cleavage dioxygenase-like enzyme
MDSLDWRPDLGSALLLLSRQTGEWVASISVGNRHCLHLINCFESDGQLCVDVIETERPVYDQYQSVPDLFVDVPEGRPIRFKIDLRKYQVLSKEEIGYFGAPDFPSIDPQSATRSYNDFWLLGISGTGRYGRKFFDELVHVRWDQPEVVDIYQAPPMHYLAGEPIFIGEPGGESNGGVVMCQLLNAERRTSAFALFDAFAVRLGPIATIHLPQPVPPGFHASFYRF